MVLAKEAARSQRRADHEFSALEARHHGFGARCCDDGAWRLLDIAQTILGELGVGHGPHFTRAQIDTNHCRSMPNAPPIDFKTPSHEVACRLIGVTLLVDGVGGRIVETEAYD